METALPFRNAVPPLRIHLQLEITIQKSNIQSQKTALITLHKPSDSSGGGRTGQREVGVRANLSIFYIMACQSLIKFLLSEIKTV